MIEHDQNYISFVVSVIFYKTGGGEGVLIREEVLILNFGRRKECLFKGGAYLRGVLFRGFAVVLVIYCDLWLPKLLSMSQVRNLCHLSSLVQCKNVKMFKRPSRACGQYDSMLH